MVYSDVINGGLLLPRKNKYTMRDVRGVMLASLFKPVNGATLTLMQAAFVVKCSAIYHDTEYSQAVGAVDAVQSAFAS